MYQLGLDTIQRLTVWDWADREFETQWGTMTFFEWCQAEAHRMRAMRAALPAEPAVLTLNRVCCIALRDRAHDSVHQPPTNTL
jgi:hypothetical protein